MQTSRAGKESQECTICMRSNTLNFAFCPNIRSTEITSHMMLYHGHDIIPFAKILKTDKISQVITVFRISNAAITISNDAITISNDAINNTTISVELMMTHSLPLPLPPHSF